MSDWVRPIEAAVEEARTADARVDFTWQGVTVRVFPSDKPVDVRMRWRCKRDWDKT